MAVPVLFAATLSPEVLAPFVYEGTTAYYRFALVDETGEDIVDTEISSLTLTYYDTISEQIINSRENQDALNTNDVTITTVAGQPLQTTVTWELQPADTIMMNTWKSSEYHTIVFRWTWDNGSKHGADRVLIAIHHLPFEP